MGSSAVRISSGEVSGAGLPTQDRCLAQSIPDNLVTVDCIPRGKVCQGILSVNAQVSVGPRSKKLGRLGPVAPEKVSICEYSYCSAVASDLLIGSHSRCHAYHDAFGKSNSGIESFTTYCFRVELAGSCGCIFTGLW